MSQFGKSFEPTGATQVEAVTSSAETISLSGRLSDRDGAVRLANIGTQTIFFTLDGSTPTASGAGLGIPLLAGTVETFSMPVGKVDVKHIAAASGSSLYVTPGRGV